MGEDNCLCSTIKTIILICLIIGGYLWWASQQNQNGEDKGRETPWKSEFISNFNPDSIKTEIQEQGWDITEFTGSYEGHDAMALYAVRPNDKTSISRTNVNAMKDLLATVGSFKNISHASISVRMNLDYHWKGIFWTGNSVDRHTLIPELDPQDDDLKLINSYYIDTNTDDGCNRGDRFGMEFSFEYQDDYDYTLQICKMKSLMDAEMDKWRKLSDAINDASFDIIGNGMNAADDLQICDYLNSKRDVCARQDASKKDTSNIDCINTETIDCSPYNIIVVDKNKAK